MISPMRAITVSTDSDQLGRVLRRVSRRLEDLTPALERIGGMVRASVVRNFELQGRPQWAPLSQTTRELRGAAGPILRRTTGAGGLAGSIAVTAGPRSVSVGTDAPHAALHHFGARKGAFGTVLARVPAHRRGGGARRPHEVKAHTRRLRVPWGDIPARPFLTLTPGDRAAIMDALKEHIVKDTP